MIKFDYHTHTDHSLDCDEPIDAMIEKAISLGLAEYAITDHIDFTHGSKKIISPYGIDANMKQMQKAKEYFAKQIKVLAGVELGLRPDLADVTADIAASYDFDIIIGSAHSDDIDLPGFRDFCLDDTLYQKLNAYDIYFDNMLKTVKACDSYDVLGHMDYVERYAIYDDRRLCYNEHKDVIDDILIVLIQKGKGIEINTSGYAYGLGRTHPQINIIKRYLELGGEIITIGSDAHSPKNIAGSFDKVYGMLKEAGIKYIARYDKRVAELTKIL